MNSNQTVVVLDDDSSIHEVWNTRFAGLGNKLVHCFKPEELRLWISENGKDNTLYLCDQELLGCSVTGLDLIVEQDIAAQSILITSRYEQKEVRDKVLNLKLTMIPKSMAGVVKINTRLENRVLSGEFPTAGLGF